MKKLLKFSVAVKVVVLFFIQVLFFFEVFFEFLFFFFKFYLFSENKNLYSCGNNDYNQKGNYTEDKLKFPTKIEFFKDIEIDNVFTGNLSAFIKTKS
jgi:hypothetical protein